MTLILWYPSCRQTIVVPDSDSRWEVERTVAMFGAVAYEIVEEPKGSEP